MNSLNCNNNRNAILAMLRKRVGLERNVCFGAIQASYGMIKILICHMGPCNLTKNIVVFLECFLSTMIVMTRGCNVKPSPYIDCYNNVYKHLYMFTMIFCTATTIEVRTTVSRRGAFP